MLRQITLAWATGVIRLTERRGASDAISTNKVACAQWQSLEYQTTFAKFMLSSLNLLEPFFPTRP